MPDFDVLIRNGMLIDGNQTPRFQSDLGIRDGRIAAIGRLARHSAAREIDAGSAREVGAQERRRGSGRVVPPVRRPRQRVALGVSR